MQRIFTVLVCSVVQRSGLTAISQQPPFPLAIAWLGKRHLGYVLAECIGDVGTFRKGGIWMQMWTALEYYDICIPKPGYNEMGCNEVIDATK